MDAIEDAEHDIAAVIEAEEAPIPAVLAQFRAAATLAALIEAESDPVAEVLAQFRAAVPAPDERSEAGRKAAGIAWLRAQREGLAPEPSRVLNRKHRRLDEWMTCRPGALQALTDDLTPAIDATEAHDRQRARKGADKDRFNDACAILLANLADAVLHPPETGRVAYCLAKPRGRRPRTSNPVLGEKVPGILRAMAALGIIDQPCIPSAARSGEATSFAPLPDFAEAVRAHAVTSADFGRYPGEDPLVLELQQPRPFGAIRRLSPRPHS